MQWFDYVILIVLIVAFIRGYTSGFVKEVGGIVSVLLGIYCSLTLSDSTAYLLLNKTSLSDPWLSILSFVLPFVVVYIFVISIVKLFSKVIKSISMNWIDSFLGGAFSLFKWVLVLSLLINLYEWIDSKKNLIGARKVEDSFLYKPTRSAISAIAPSFKDIKFDKLKKKSDFSLPKNKTRGGKSLDSEGSNFKRKNDSTDNSGMKLKKKSEKTTDEIIEEKIKESIKI